MEQLFDLHIHSRHSSDSETPVSMIFESARRRGLSGIAVTDHDMFSGAEEALMLAPPDLLIVPGIELSTEYGHMLCYFLREDPKKAGLKKGKNGFFSFQEVCAFAKSQDALLFAAHPYRSRLFTEDILPQLCGIEAFNGGNTARKEWANEQAMALAERKELPFSAGSDAHVAQQVGTGARIFDLPELASLKDLRQKLCMPGGAVYGKYSPTVIEAFLHARNYLGKKKYKRALRQYCKAAAGCILDPLAPLRTSTRMIAHGTVFEIGGSR